MQEPGRQLCGHLGQTPALGRDVLPSSSSELSQERGAELLREVLSGISS